MKTESSNSSLTENKSENSINSKAQSLKSNVKTPPNSEDSQTPAPKAISHDPFKSELEDISSREESK